MCRVSFRLLLKGTPHTIANFFYFDFENNISVIKDDLLVIRTQYYKTLIITKSNKITSEQDFQIGQVILGADFKIP